MARRLVVPKSARSEVWNYFGFEADESGSVTDLYRRYVWCRLCDTQLLFSGNTTNLSAHIARCRKAPKSQDVTAIQKQKISSDEVCKESEDTPQEASDCDTSYELQEVEYIADKESVTEDDQQFCLKWKYHHSNQLTMFSKLLERESFCDVTIACEEKLIRAHKLVLSACSSYFEMVLSRYEDQTPIIILKDVKHEDMYALVQFMYQGEVNIAQSQLPSLLETADMLKIKGLSDMCAQVSDCTVADEGVEMSSNEQGKRCLQDDNSPRPVKIARRSTSVELTATTKTEIQQDGKNVELGEKVIRLPDFLKGHGTYQEYWKKPWVVTAMQAVSDREMTLRNCSDLLGVSYNILYSRYRMLYGCLKEPTYDSSQSPGTSRSYTVKLVSPDHSGNIVLRRDQLVGRSHIAQDRLVGTVHSDKDQGGKIVLRRDQLSPAAAVLTVTKRDVQSLVSSGEADSEHFEVVESEMVVQDSSEV